MSARSPLCVEANPLHDPKATVIWLHGLGADGYDFQPIVSQLGLAPELCVRFIFPHAPQRSVSINHGAVMRAWFDINAHMESNHAQLHEAEQLIRGYIDEEVAQGIPHENIILAGFSQGGALALYTALRFPYRLAGIMSLSGFLPFEEECLGNHEANQHTPLFLAHGYYDPIVPFQGGRMVYEALVEHDYPAAWHEYPIEHQVSPPEIRDIGQWITGLLTPVACQT